MDSQENNTELLRRALNLLARREHSRTELAHKLARYSDDPQAIEQVLERCALEGWQDECRYARMRVRARAEAGWGPQMIRQELRQRGLTDEMIDQGMADAGIDWLEAAKHYALRRRLPVDSAQARWKSAGKLMQRGFNRDLVAEVIRSLEQRDIQSH